MAARLIYVGLDVGGTTMKAAAVDDNGSPLSAPVVMDTNPSRGQEAGLETMCETIRRAISAAGATLADVTAIGVATPGLMDIKAGLILDPKGDFKDKIAARAKEDAELPKGGAGV